MRPTDRRSPHRPAHRIAQERYGLTRPDDHELPIPQTGAYEGLFVGKPLLLCVVASGYYSVGVTQADSFTQSMIKVGAVHSRHGLVLRRVR